MLVLDTNVLSEAMKPVPDALFASAAAVARLFKVHPATVSRLIAQTAVPELS